jgi:molybdate transport system substrate-binding protein
MKYRLSRLPLLALLLGAALCTLPWANATAAELRVLAAGAVQSTVNAVLGEFEQASGHTVKLSYGGVGALLEKIVAGEPADATIVTPAILAQLEAKGLARPGTRTDLGRVGGGIAVRMGAVRPPVGTPEELKQALLAAERVYYADPKVATSGAYLMKVADQMGIGDAVRAKGRTAPAGREAMQLMAKDEGRALGITQISEIVTVKEVVLIGPFPGNLQVFTVYTGVVLTKSAHPDAAAAFLAFLASAPVRERFVQAGYEPVK